MKALVYDEDLKLVKDYPNPVLGENEVLIKTIMAGICNTDYEITQGYMGYKGVIGHEFVGRVVDVGCKVDKNLKNLPIIPIEYQPKYKIVGNIDPSDNELINNNRARSAKLRIIERVR